MRDEPIDALFVMPNLSPGGAERVAVTLLANLDPARVRARLLMVDSRDAAWLDSLPARVEVQSLGHGRLRGALPALLRAIRAARPDLVFSMQWHLNATLALARPLLPNGTALLARETSMTGAAIAASAHGWLRHRLMRIAYPRLDMLIAQGEATRADLLALGAAMPERIAILPNPLAITRIRENAADPSVSTGYRHEGPEFVMLGRLTPVKGIDRALAAFALGASERARLTIVGAGPLLTPLRAQAAMLGIDARVRFVGYQANPYPYLAGASAMLIASHHEGFPNAALEAMALGTPVLALPSPGGTAEALAASPVCQIAEAASAEALAALLAGFARRAAIAPQRVAPDALARHDAPRVAATLADLFEVTIARRRAAEAHVPGQAAR